MPLKYIIIIHFKHKIDEMYNNIDKVYILMIFDDFI